MISIFVHTTYNSAENNFIRYAIFRFLIPISLVVKIVKVGIGKTIKSDGTDCVI